MPVVPTEIYQVPIAGGNVVVISNVRDALRAPALLSLSTADTLRVYVPSSNQVSKTSVCVVPLCRFIVPISSPISYIYQLTPMPVSFAHDRERVTWFVWTHDPLLGESNVTCVGPVASYR